MAKGAPAPVSMNYSQGNAGNSQSTNGSTSIDDWKRLLNQKGASKNNAPTSQNTSNKRANAPSLPPTNQIPSRIVNNQIGQAQNVPQHACPIEKGPIVNQTEYARVAEHLKKVHGIEITPELIARNNKVFAADLRLEINNYPPLVKAVAEYKKIWDAKLKQAPPDKRAELESQNDLLWFILLQTAYNDGMKSDLVRHKLDIRSLGQRVGIDPTIKEQYNAVTQMLISLFGGNQTIISMIVSAFSQWGSAWVAGTLAKGMAENKFSFAKGIEKAKPGEGIFKQAPYENPGVNALEKMFQNLFGEPIWAAELNLFDKAATGMGVPPALRTGLNEAYTERNLNKFVVNATLGGQESVQNWLARYVRREGGNYPVRLAELARNAGIDLKAPGGPQKFGEWMKSNWHTPFHKFSTNYVFRNFFMAAAGTLSLTLVWKIAYFIKTKTIRTPDEAQKAIYAFDLGDIPGYQSLVGPIASNTLMLAGMEAMVKAPVAMLTNLIFYGGSNMPAYAFYSILQAVLGSLTESFFKWKPNAAAPGTPTPPATPGSATPMK